MTQKLTTTARLGLASAALLGLAACSTGHNPTVSSAPPPSAPAAAPTAPVTQATIKDVQSSLQQAGYYKNATVDGVWGPRTERAVRRFQHDHNLPANGKLDIPTMRALNLTGAPPSTSANGNAPDNNAAVNNEGSNTAPNGGTTDNGSGTGAPPPPPPANAPANSGNGGTNAPATAR